MHKIKKHISLILKLLIAVLIIKWLLYKKMLDFNLLLELFANPKYLIIGVIGMISTIMITTYRFKLLLQLRSAKIPFFKILQVNWIGIMFSSILPGAVTGDILKLFYVQNLNPTLERSFTMSAILFDRIIGLTALLLLAGFSAIFTYDELAVLSPKLIPIILFNFGMAFAAILFFLSFFATKKIHIFIINLIKRVPLVGLKFEKLFEQMWFIGSNSKLIIRCLVLSMFVQAQNIGMFWLLSSFIVPDLPFKFTATLIPIGFVTMAIPISPGGLGIGHAFFAFLFSLIGISIGASLFNNYFILWTIINLLGFIPYIFYRKKGTHGHIIHK